MTSPRLTIGLIVRNGEAHLAETMRSLLDQSFGDFVLVVHDNASTDNSASIAEQFTARDSRVTVVRRPENVGVIENLCLAAEAATTPLFCWAAHDDLREPAFLATLIDLLDRHRHAGLACCAARNIDPDGTRRDVRPETMALRTSEPGDEPAQRLQNYLRDAAGTPFYGVFRTAALRTVLPGLRRCAGDSPDAPPMLGLDIVFLAAFIREHALAVTHEPLLLFRRGGISHRIERYGSLSAYLREMHRFARELRSATRCGRAPRRDQSRLAAARRRYLLRLWLGTELRAMTMHYLVHSLPVLKALRDHARLHASTPFMRLKQRARSLPRGTRIVIFGAGKHTSRCIGSIMLAFGKHRPIIAVCDDRPPREASIAGVRVLPASELHRLRPDVVLVSSDAYEAALHNRACAETAGRARVWTMYDHSLEAATSASSSDSIEARKPSMTSMASPASQS